MMRLFATIMAAAMILAPAAAFAAEKKPLVIVFSRSGSARAVADEAARLTGADIFEIVPVKPYPSVYSEVVDLVKKQLAENARPALKQLRAPGLAERGVVILATPNWWGQLPPPVMTFLEANDLGGKKVLQIVSHGGGGVQRCPADLKKAAPKAVLSAPFSASGSSTSGLRQWLAQNGLAVK